MLTCHKCKNKLHENVKFCGHCGIEVKRQTTHTLRGNQNIAQGNGANSTITAQESESAYCNGCGMEISTKAKFCPKCGVKQRKGDTTTAKEETPKLSSIKKTSAFGWKAAAVVCAVVVLLLLVVKMQQGGYDGGTVTNYGGLQGGAAQGQSGQNGGGALTRTGGGSATTQPENRDRNTPIFSTSTKSGCAYDNPPCSSDYYCENNVCVKKQGCQYNNPSCQSNQDCINNQCVLKSGCRYNNPSCPSGYDCINNQCIERIVCGDGKCQQGESSNNCCTDCGCQTGETCQNNACVELKPEVQANFNQAGSYSSTILLSKDNRVTIGKISLNNVGNDAAQNVKLTITSPQNNFNQFTKNIGTIGKGMPSSLDVILDYNEKLLDLPNNAAVPLNIVIDYSNSANKPYSSTVTGSFSIYGKESMRGATSNNAYAAWVTPHQNVIREFAAKSTAGIAAALPETTNIEKKLAARWLFESMKIYGISYVNDVFNIGDYVQFPYEVLKRRTGDCEDLALFYASLLESIGMESRIVLVPDHAFAGYIDKDGDIVPVETTADDFNSALSIGSSEYTSNLASNQLTVVNPRQGWNEYKEVDMTNEPSIPLPDIQKQIGKCYFTLTLSQGWVAKAPVTFHNSGAAAGAGCAAILTVDASGPVGNDMSCWPLNPGETKSFDYIADISLGNLMNYGDCVAYPKSV